MGMADALVKNVANRSPTNPIASAVFDMTHLSSLRYGLTLAYHLGVSLPRGRPGGSRPAWRVERGILRTRNLSSFGGENLSARSRVQR